MCAGLCLTDKELLFLALRVSHSRTSSASVALNALAFAGEKPPECWQAGHPSLREGNVRCPRSGLDSVLLLYDPHVLSLSSSLEITNVLIKDLLRYTETWAQLRLSLKLWFLSFYKISTGSVCGPGPVNLPVEFSVSWSRAGLRCHPFLPQCSAELFIAPHCRSSHFCFLIMLNEETERSF